LYRQIRMSEISSKIGNIIRKKRVEKDITQEMLALQCNIDRSYMGRIERGEVNLTVEKLYMIAKVLEVDVKQLLP
jgi:transcriptional regulator with XRE-family HTH domain